MPILFQKAHPFALGGLTVDKQNVAYSAAGVVFVDNRVVSARCAPESLRRLIELLISYGDIELQGLDAVVSLSYAHDIARRMPELHVVIPLIVNNVLAEVAVILIRIVRVIPVLRQKVRSAGHPNGIVKSVIGLKRAAHTVVRSELIEVISGVYASHEAEGSEYSAYSRPASRRAVAALPGVEMPIRIIKFRLFIRIRAASGGCGDRVDLIKGLQRRDCAVCNAPFLDLRARNISICALVHAGKRVVPS